MAIVCLHRCLLFHIVTFVEQDGKVANNVVEKLVWLLHAAVP